MSRRGAPRSDRRGGRSRTDRRNPRPEPVYPCSNWGRCGPDRKIARRVKGVQRSRLAMRGVTMAPVQRTFIDAPDGTVHCAIAGAGRPVVLLHQTPRSWDEYRDVIPILAQRFRAIAIDTIGFGDSSRASKSEASIENWARTVIDVLDALHIRRASFVGHHTGPSSRRRSRRPFLSGQRRQFSLQCR